MVFQRLGAGEGHRHHPLRFDRQRCAQGVGFGGVGDRQHGPHTLRRQVLARSVNSSQVLPSLRPQSPAGNSLTHLLCLFCVLLSVWFPRKCRKTRFLIKLSCLGFGCLVQIASVRDISKSSIEEFSKSSGGGRRLLRLGLTDGHTEITAIEYSQIPSIPDDVVPGTKVISVAWRFCSAFASLTY